MIEQMLQPLVCGRFRSDSRYREGHLRVINALPQRRVLGLHTPEMKQAARQISRSGCAAVLSGGEVRHCSNGTQAIACFGQVPPESLCYEETVIWGFLINMEKCAPEEHFAMLAKYVPVLDNWAVCDAFCANAKWMAKVDKQLLWHWLQQWFGSRREFEVRFAIVASMCYLLCDEWTGKVFEMVESLPFSDIVSQYRSIKGKPKTVQEGSVQGTSPYYVRMAAAWLLATALARFPEQTRAFVRGSRLPADVVRLYVRKARESFRTRTLEAL